MITQVWIHRPSGCLYAVAFIRYEFLVTEASDEITQKEVESVLRDGFDSHLDSVEFVNYDSDKFDLYAYLDNDVVVFN